MLAAMLYPVLILHIAAFVFPLPGLILGPLTVNAYLLSVLKILLILYIPVAIVLVIMLLRDRAPLLRLPLDMLVLRVPVLGLAVYHMSVCRYAKAFAMLYGAGVPIVETTERATRVTGNLVVTRQFEGAKASVREGGMVWEGFSSRIPTEYRNLWQIGEETGELDKTSDKIAEIAGDRADLFFTEFARWLPRVIYFIILVIVASMIFTLAQQIQRNISAGHNTF